MQTTAGVSFLALSLATLTLPSRARLAVNARPAPFASLPCWA